LTDAPALPYGHQSVAEDDIAAVAEVLRGDWLTGGPAVAAFEHDVAALVDAPHAVACSSGTAALHIAALALGIQPGDRVVVPAVTFLASANAFRFEGAEIVFADIDPVTGLMTAETLSRVIDGRTGKAVRAIVPVHLGGRCFDPAAIADIAETCGAAVVEDACHALGTRYLANGAPAVVGACRHADMAVFSFHPVKTATMGEGGVVTTRDDAVAKKLRLVRNHGMSRDPADFQNAALALDADGAPNPWYYEADCIAPNYRASDIHCALGRSQLRRMPEFTARRAALAARYASHLAGMAPLLRPVDDVPGCTPVLHLYAVHVDFAGLGVDRAAFMRALAQRGVGSQVHYMPLHMQPYYRRLNPALSLPGAEAYYASTLSIPLFPAMTDGEQDRVIAALGDIIESCGKAGA
jgi:UDP-4-amino-4,6-dideoxy-N-acetyl-beta-L-altrosamine transaminase